MNDLRGFTLVEVMVAMAIFGIVMTGIYQTYLYQQKSYIKQEQVVDMQQSLRAGLFFLKRDIRMAGYDPTGDATSTITIADVGELEFEVDENGSGTIGDGSKETIRYALTNDADGNGFADGFPCNLGREYNLAGGLQPVAEDIQALEFCYVLDDGTVTTAATDPENIRSIIVSMLIRTASPIKGYIDSRPYTQASQDMNLTPNWTTDGSSSRPASAWGPFDDAYKRRLLVAKLKCRNIGIDPFAD